MNDHQMLSKELDPLTPDPGPPLKGPGSRLGLQDKKKIAILAVLMVLAFTVIAFQFLRAGGPKTAEADPSVLRTKGPAASADEIDSVLKRLESAARQDDMSVVRVERLVKEFDGYVRRRQVPLARLQVNPFRVYLAQGQQVTRETTEEEAKRQQIHDAAAQLVLGSVLVAGEKRFAVISGKVCCVGDSVSGFRVQQIEPDRVTLVCEGETVTLMLPQH